MQLLLQLIEVRPDVFFQAPFPLAFRATMAALTLLQTDLVLAALDLFRMILSHDSLDPPTPVPPKFPGYAVAIKAVVQKEGPEFVGLLLSGLVGDFPEDAASSVVTIFRSVGLLFPAQLLTWLPGVMQQLPASGTPTQAKQQFLDDTTNAINIGQLDKVKYCLLGLHRAARKTRDRRRVAALDDE